VLQWQGGMLVLHCHAAAEWKLGWRAAPAALQVDLPVPGAVLRYTRSMPLDPAAQHAHGHPLEVFNAPGLPYFEVESHSPLVALAPGGSFGWQVDEGLQGPVAGAPGA